MNTISSEHAFEILAKWLEEKSALQFFAGGSGRIDSQFTVVRDITGKVITVSTLVDTFPALVSLDFSNAIFEFSDEREIVLRDETVERPTLDSLAVTLPDGRKVMFLEFRR